MTMTINKTTSRIVAVILALCAVCAFSATAFAAEIDTSGGSGTTPINLTTTNDGLDGEATTPTKLNVIVPTSLPMAMRDDGSVVTATDCKIINNSYGAVRVKTVTITAAPGWNLTAFGDKSTLAAEKVDANKLGFAMSIGGGAQVMTTSDNPSQVLIASPMTGCFMTGVGDPSGNTVAISYEAIVTPLSGAVENVSIANIVFVIEWDFA